MCVKDCVKKAKDSLVGLGWGVMVSWVLLAFHPSVFLLMQPKKIKDVDIDNKRSPACLPITSHVNSLMSNQISHHRSIFCSPLTIKQFPPSNQYKKKHTHTEHMNDRFQKNILQLTPLSNFFSLGFVKSSSLGNLRFFVYSCFCTKLLLFLFLDICWPNFLLLNYSFFLFNFEKN